MATQPDAQVTVQHLHHAALLHRKMAGRALTEEQRMQLERHRSQLQLAARARGERTP